MAKRTTKKPARKKSSRTKKAKTPSIWSRVRRWGFWLVCGLVLLVIGLGALWSVVNPPVTIYMLQERARLGVIERKWVAIDDVAPVMARSVVAAEDANFCEHWGFDLDAIRDAIADGGSRGASTLTQQVVKNVYLWHGRSWLRKALEAGMTPVVEMFWSKRRILEVYLNVAAFDEGVFGVHEASWHYFGTGAADLTATQAARLAAILPDPKGRSASRPSSFVRKRSGQIVDGAATIAKDGRSACFES